MSTIRPHRCKTMEQQQQQQSLLRSPPSYYHTSQSCYHLLILIVVTLATTSLLPVHGVIVDCPLGHATNVPGCPPKTLWSLSADTEMVEDAPSKWRMVGGASASIKPSQITSDGSNELDLRRDGAVAQDDGGPHLQRTDGGTLLGGAAFSFCAWVTFEEETTKVCLFLSLISPLSPPLTPFVSYNFVPFHWQSRNPRECPL